MGIKIESLLKIAKNGKKNICYGAGVYGQQLLGFLRAHGFDIEYFVISKLDKNEKIFGVPILNINNIMNYNEYNWIVAVSDKYVDEIKYVLETKSINPCYIMDNNDIEDIIKDALLPNEALNNSIQGNKRCFIMGTGGTIKLQNLKLLHNEDVFSCSFCSLIDDYEYIRPEYYILPALTSDPVHIGKERETYIREKIDFFSKTIISPIVFCDYKDRNYIQYYNGFKGKEIYYLQQTEKWDEKRTDVYNLCEKTPTIQTGSIMMLKIAMYMGYKKIYLIGTEHDLFTHKYGHAYDLELLKEMGFSELLDIALLQNIYVEKQSNREILHMSLNMYNEYYYLHSIAKYNNIKIYNATIGGSLDEFERIKFENLF